MLSISRALESGIGISGGAVGNSRRRLKQVLRFDDPIDVDVLRLGFVACCRIGLSTAVLPITSEAMPQELCGNMLYPSCVGRKRYLALSRPDPRLLARRVPRAGSLSRDRASDPGQCRAESARGYPVPEKCSLCGPLRRRCGSPKQLAIVFTRNRSVRLNQRRSGPAGRRFLNLG